MVVNDSLKKLRPSENASADLETVYCGDQSQSRSVKKKMQKARNGSKVAACFDMEGNLSVLSIPSDVEDHFT